MPGAGSGGVVGCGAPPPPPPCRSSTLPTISTLAALWIFPSWPTAASMPPSPRTMLASGLPPSALDASRKKRAFAASSALLNPGG